MLVNPRRFEATDPFGRPWTAILVFYQNAISIRHADAIDVKWELTASDGTKMERVVALMHPHLLALSRKLGREMSDSWCIRLAALHLRHLIETWEDAEKTIVTPTLDQLEAEARKVEATVQTVP
ncbi:MAG TPA: hypothetical protein VM120_28865 [Bryobacteraceae bacterium]|nr:hypothetical protein [Bryobacteraceae bacterium]